MTGRLTREQLREWLNRKPEPKEVEDATETESQEPKVEPGSNGTPGDRRDWVELELARLGRSLATTRPVRNSVGNSVDLWETSAYPWNP
jgi:hypothetical protein